ncbi:MAG: phage major capsid protein [Candidatus Poribacteria bacterium]|nr:phage major capsid protein [Candidatus Poribacteria bacterium]
MTKREQFYELSHKYNIPAEFTASALRQDITISDFKDAILERLQQGNLDRKSHSTFSLRRLILDKADNAALRDEEQSVTDRIKEHRQPNSTSRGIPLPASILREIPTGKRDLTAGVDSAGGYTVDDELQALIFPLDPQTPIFNAATKVDSKSPYTIPIKQTPTSAQWVAETQAASEQNIVFNAKNVTSHYLRSFTSYSRELLSQSSTDIENLVRDDLRKAIMFGIENKLANSTAGSLNSPLGLANMNLNEVTFTAANGLTYENVLEVEEAVLNRNVAVQNSEGNLQSGERGYPLRLAWVASPKMRRLMRKTPQLPNGSIPIWDTGDVGNDSVTIHGEGSPNMPRVLDYRAEISTDIPDAHAYFGNWRDLVLSTFSGFDLLVDPYTLGHQGIIRVFAYTSINFFLRHTQSISRLKEI